MSSASASSNWAHSKRLGAWNVAGSFAFIALAVLIETFLGFVLPNPLSLLVMVVTALCYAQSQEVLGPGAIADHLQEVALRAALFTCIWQLLFAACAIAIGMRADPNVAATTTWVLAHFWVVPFIAGGSFLMSWGLIYIGLRGGVLWAARSKRHGVSQDS